MSTIDPSIEDCSSDISPDTHTPYSKVSKPQRVLACVLCQQRKVKCDRKFPCANCIKFRTQCVPATLVRPRRRRRFPERALLERLRDYEALLRQNNITFEPLPEDSAGEKRSHNAEIASNSDGGHPENMEPDVLTPSTKVKSEGGFEAKYALFKDLV